MSGLFMMLGFAKKRGDEIYSTDCQSCGQNYLKTEIHLQGADVIPAQGSISKEQDGLMQIRFYGDTSKLINFNNLFAVTNRCPGCCHPNGDVIANLHNFMDI